MSELAGGDPGENWRTPRISRALGWPLRAIPAVVFFATATAGAVAGVVEISYGVTFTGSGAGVGALVVGAALIGAATVMVLLAFGVWRGYRSMIQVGLVVSGFALALCGWIAISA